MRCNCGFTDSGSTSWRVVATFAAVAGGWVVDANQYGRMAALALIAASTRTGRTPPPRELADFRDEWKPVRQVAAVAVSAAPVL